MKNNFLITEDEKNRILNLHITESSIHGTTKNKELIKEIQSIVKGTAETLVDIGKTNKTFLQDLKSAMSQVGIQGVKSVEEFSAAIKDGKIAATDAMKVYSKLFEMNKSLAQEVLATVKESPSFKDLVNLSFPQGKAFLNAEGKLTADAAKKMELIKNYYAKAGLKPEAIEQAIRDLKSSGISSEIKIKPKSVLNPSEFKNVAKVEASSLGKELVNGGLVKDAKSAGIAQGTNIKIVNIVDGEVKVVKNGAVDAITTGKEFFLKMPLWQKVASIGALAGLIYLLTGDDNPDIVVPTQAEPLITNENYFPPYVMLSDCKSTTTNKKRGGGENKPVEPNPEPITPITPIVGPGPGPVPEQPSPELQPQQLPDVNELAGRTDLTKGECKGLFQIIDSRDEQNGGKTANESELTSIKACLQQYNFIGDKHGKIKRRYGMTGSGGDKAI